jgi:AraC family transcriptional regulator
MWKGSSCADRRSVRNLRGMSWQPAGASRARVLLLGSVRVSEVMFAPRLHLPLHEHERHTMAVSLSGEYDTIARRTVRSTSGSALVEPSGDRHECNFGAEGARVLVIQPQDEDLARDVFASLFAERRALRDRGMMAAALRVGRELCEPDPSTPLAVEGLALQILADAARGFADSRQEPRQAWLDRAEEKLRSCLTRPIRLSEVAAAAGVHPVHLQRVFRSHHGVPIGAWHRRLRLDWAAHRLSATRTPLIAIALDAGFADQSHFTRAFVRAFGISPSRYRREAKR